MPRRWVAPAVEGDSGSWREAWASLHDDGSVSLAAAAGGHRVSGGESEAWQLRSDRIEMFVADLMALLRVASRESGGDYELRMGLVWDGEQPLEVFRMDDMGLTYESTQGVERFQPVRAMVQPGTDMRTFREQARDIAMDMINQAGLQTLRVLHVPDEPV